MKDTILKIVQFLLLSFGGFATGAKYALPGADGTPGAPLFTEGEWTQFSGELCVAVAALIGAAKIGAAVWKRRSAAITAAKTVVPALLIGTAALGLAGCANTAAPVSPESIATASRLSAKYAVKLILDANPRQTDAVAAVNGAVAVLLETALGGGTDGTGAPDLAALTSAVRAIAPDLSAGDATTLAAVLKDVADLVRSALPAPEIADGTGGHIATLAIAITRGISEGVALHNAAALPHS